MADASAPIVGPWIVVPVRENVGSGWLEVIAGYPQLLTERVEEARNQAVYLAEQHEVPYAVQCVRMGETAAVPAGDAIGYVGMDNSNYNVWLAKPRMPWAQRNRIIDERYVAAVRSLVTDVLCEIDEWMTQDDMLGMVADTLRNVNGNGSPHASVSDDVTRLRADLCKYLLLSLSQLPDLDDWSPVVHLTEDKPATTVAA